MKIEMHVHSRYSKDSILPVFVIYLKCLIKHIDVVAITDHNTIKGGIALSRMTRRKHNLHVIVGSEIMTQEGEIIGLFLKEEIEPFLTVEETIRKIKNQNGIVYIPHPYDELRKKTVLNEERIKQFSESIDCIECYNGRNIDESFGSIQDSIADKYNIKKVIGSDAHTCIELARNTMNITFIPDTSEKFRQMLENDDVEYNKCSCIKYAHKFTKFAKLVKLLFGGRIGELYRIISRKINRKGN